MARHIDGRIARAKVLSTSAFRGVVRGGSERSLVVEFTSDLSLKNIAEFFAGFVIHGVSVSITHLED